MKEIHRKRINFSLNTDIEERIKILSKKLKITMSEIIRRSLEDFEKKFN